MSKDSTPTTPSPDQAQQIFRHDYQDNKPDPEPLRKINSPPPWRQFGKKDDKDNKNEPFQKRNMDPEQERRGRFHQIDETTARLINVSLILRRPMLVSGHAGTGKSSLAYAIAWQLGLGNVLRWPITSRSTLKEALYSYDAIARLQDAALRQNGVQQTIDPHEIGRYITLGPLGTALLPNRQGPYQPRVLLIDEIDKSDIDLPNDLLHVFEEGFFEIPEIARVHTSKDYIKIQTSTKNIDEPPEVPANGLIKCDDFPIVILTTNGERDFSPAFRRRCIEITICGPDKAKLERIIHSQLESNASSDDKTSKLLDEFYKRITENHSQLAIDQLLNGIYLSRSNIDVDPTKHKAILEAVFRSLTEAGSPPTEPS